ncbi:MAG: hypothetical protein U1F49_07735 [Rubrivivax sp.]
MHNGPPSFRASGEGPTRAALAVPPCVPQDSRTTPISFNWNTDGHPSGSLRGALGWLVAGAALVGGTANAAVITQTLNVGGILSNEELGSAQNEVRFLNFAGAQVRVIGLSWDVDLYADSPSWLSEISVDLSSPLEQLP